jgi:hypothetical protein
MARARLESDERRSLLGGASMAAAWPLRAAYISKVEMAVKLVKQIVV